MVSGNKDADVKPDVVGNSSTEELPETSEKAVPEKDTHDSDTPAPEQDEAGAADGDVVELDDDEHHEEIPHKATKREIIARLLQKNEMILELSKKNNELEAKVKKLEDLRLRAAAEFENYRKRTRKEWDLLKQQTKAEVILEILEVVDNFERALSVAGDEKDDFIQGIRLIYNNMVSILNKLGVKKMDALNARFDPMYHMAVGKVESSFAKSNHIVEVIQEGYMLDDTVIRPANVVIAK